MKKAFLIISAFIFLTSPASARNQCHPQDKDEYLNCLILESRDNDTAMGKIYAILFPKTEQLDSSHELKGYKDVLSNYAESWPTYAADHCNQGSQETFEGRKSNVECFSQTTIRELAGLKKIQKQCFKIDNLNLFTNCIDQYKDHSSN